MCRIAVRALSALGAKRNASVHETPGKSVAGACPLGKQPVPTMKSVRLPLWNAIPFNVSGVVPVFEIFNCRSRPTVPTRCAPKYTLRTTRTEVACGCAGSAAARLGASAVPAITAVAISAMATTRPEREPLVMRALMRRARPLCTVRPDHRPDRRSA